MGALLVIKPGFGMTAGMGYASLGGLFYGCMLVANRWLAGIYRPRFILISTLIFGTIVLAPFSVDSIPSLNKQISLLILLSALSSAIGNLLIIEANRRLPASVIAPFVYFQLIGALFLGWLIFDTWPDSWGMLGLGLLIISGFGSAFLRR